MEIPMHDASHSISYNRKWRNVELAIEMLVATCLSLAILAIIFAVVAAAQPALPYGYPPAHRLTNAQGYGYRYGPITYRLQAIIVTHIMFMLIMKRWPKEDYHIDHRDGDISNCEWSNLREVTPSQRNYNIS
jgi:hypothetical protein